MQRSVTVLKFGGSVLDGDAGYGRAATEVHRWRRRGDRVVAVVSAEFGETEALLAEAGDLRAEQDPHALARWLAGGEERSAARFALHLARAGIPVRVLDAAALGFIAEGHPLDAAPVRVDTSAIADAHAEDEVVVVPGFAARDTEGRTVLLGRGGSDGSALFLAGALRSSRCRLLKDVDGLYEWDPARSGPAPRRYATVSFEDALATDGTIVQHKAVEHARALGIGFEVAAVGGEVATEVGVPSAFARHSGGTPEEVSPLRVALLGRGTVGAGVEALLARYPQRFELSGILVRDVERAISNGADPGLVTSEADRALRDADLVVEVLGGIEPARELVERAIRGGASVVTANKALIAAHGPELRALARACGARILDSASAGGCMPLLERSARGDRPRRVSGVLNGTVNAVLDAVARGVALEAAVADAQACGLAEADPTRDLDGRDAADKLAVLAGCVGATLDPGAIPREHLDDAAVLRARAAAEKGRVLRQVSVLWFEDGAPRGKVAFEECDLGTPFAVCTGPGNGALIERGDGSVERVAGAGAGRWPTAESVLGDLLEVACSGPVAALTP